MNNTVLQVPISKTIRATATEVALENGFSSLQEVVRVLINRYSKRQLVLNVEDMPVYKLSARAEKRYNKISDDIKHGKNFYVVNNIDEFKKLIDS